MDESGAKLTVAQASNPLNTVGVVDVPGTNVILYESIQLPLLHTADTPRPNPKLAK
jgi:hypothetical protein